MNQIKEQILGILGGIDRAGMDAVIEYLNASNYFTRGCYHHHKERGGLAKHCFEVYTFMSAHAEGLSAESIAVAALFHDLGKTRRRDGRGHGQRSLDILKECGFPLTPDERTAIGRHHSVSADFLSCPLRRLLTRGDCDSTGRWKHEHHNKKSSAEGVSHICGRWEKI